MRGLSYIFFTFFLSSCVGGYYGYTAKQWASLSEQEQEQAKAQYRQLLAGKNGFINPDEREEATDRFTKAVDQNTPASRSELSTRSNILGDHYVHTIIHQPCRSAAHCSGP